MDARLISDLERFFAVFDQRTAAVMTAVPSGTRGVLAKELELLREPVLRRAAE